MYCPRLKYYFLLLAFSMVCGLCPAQDHGFFKQIWLDEGLSQSSITAISQDEKGFMWFGTQDGLNRYDGRRMEKFNFQPFGGNSLVSDDIMSVLPFDGGKMWCQTLEGIDEIDAATLQIKNLFSSKQNETGEQAIFPIRMWRVGNSVYSFTRRGVFELKSQNGKLSWNRLSSAPVKKRDAPFSIRKICAGPSNTLLLATSEGVCVYKKDEKTFVPFEFETTSGKFTFDNECADVIYDGESVIFCQENEILFCNPENKTLVSWEVPVNGKVQINSLLKDNHGKVWVGTVGEGIFVLEMTAEGKIQVNKNFRKTNQNKYGLNCDFINCLYQQNKSDEDIVWIGSRDAGVFQYSYSANSFSLISADMKLPAQNFFSITQDSSGYIWASTNTNLVKFKPGSKEYFCVDVSHFSGSSFRPIEAAYTDSLGRVWIGNSNRLFRLDVKSGNLIQENDKLTPAVNSIVFAVTGTKRDELIIGTQAGIVYYNVTTREKRLLDSIVANGQKIRVPSTAGFCVDSKKNVWAATHNGLIQIGRNGVNRYFQNDPKNPFSLLSNVVMTVCEGANGEMLIGTSKGLSVLEKNTDDKFTNYFSVPGLSNNFIYGIVKGRDDKYWMTTNYGIAVFDLDKRKFRTYTASDGTSLNEFNSAGYYSTSDGQLLFGGLGGLVGVYPSRLAHNATSPEIVFVGARVDESSFSNLPEFLSRKIVLPHDHNTLAFDFSILDFAGAAHSKLFFSFSRDNADEWIEVKGDKLFRLSFTDLAHGNYLLKLKAVNAEGKESKTPLVLNFTVKPPFWNTPLFYFLIIAGVLLLSYLVYRIRLRNKIALMQKLEQIRLEENDRVRKAAALDLHDEFGNGLTRISMLVETLKMRIPDEQKDIKTVLNVISENTLRMYNGTKDFIWSINPTNDNLYETLIRIKDFGDELFFDSGTDFKAEGLDEKLKDKKHAPGTGRNLVMIFKEALSNTVKHSGANNVKLNVEQSTDKIILSLTDNGKGFDLEKRNGGFGLGNMKQRAQRIGSELEIRSNGGSGTILKVKINREVNQQ